jgi:serine protease AprX
VRDETARAYTVRIERSSDVTAATAGVAATGASVFSQNGAVITVLANPAQLDAIARVLDVASIENFALRQKHNEYGGGIVIGASAVHAAGYDGSTQTIAIAHSGLGNGTGANAHLMLTAKWP